MTSIGMGPITASGRSRHAGTVFAVIKTRKRARGRLTGGMENTRARIILWRRARLEPEGLLADRNTQRKIGKRAKILMLAWPGWCPLVGCGFSGMIAAMGGVGLVGQAVAAGSPTISSSRKDASVSSVMELACRSANLSFHSSGMAPMRRTLASSFCKMPTTSALRLSSPFGRYCGGAK